MKSTSDKSSKKSGWQADDENVRYKINTQYLNKMNKSPNGNKKQDNHKSDEEDVRYKFPTVLLTRTKMEQKPKSKNKIKVNFWSGKQTGTRVQNNGNIKAKINRRHTVAAVIDDKPSKPKNSGVKVRKRVSFLPTPLFSDNHVPMVTVPDDLTIQFNEEEANVLRKDLNPAVVHNQDNNNQNRKPKQSPLKSNQQSPNRKRSFEVQDPRMQGNDNELEFFSKYIVQKLRKMETNQRIYSENLINTVIMLGQLGKLNVKSKIAPDA